MKILIKYPNVCFQGGPPLPGLEQTLLWKWSGRAPLPWNDMFEVRDGKEAKQDHNDFCVSQVRHFFSNLWAHSRTGCRGSAPSTTSSIWSKQQNPVCWSTWVQSLLNLSQRISWKNCLQTWHPVKSTAWIDTVGLKKDFLVENVFLANPAN